MSFPYAFIQPPDYKSALIEYLRSVPELTAAVAAANILGRVPVYTGNQEANYLAIVAAGGRESVYTIPLMYPHLQAHCMGTNGFESMRIWRLLKGALEHPSYRMDGFVRQGCIIASARVGLPLEQPDVGIQTWDKRIAPIYLTVNEVPVSV